MTMTLAAYVAEHANEWPERTLGHCHRGGSEMYTRELVEGRWVNYRCSVCGEPFDINNDLYIGTCLVCGQRAILTREQENGVQVLMCHECGKRHITQEQKELLEIRGANENWPDIVEDHAKSMNFVVP